MYHYLKQSDDENHVKVILITIILAFFVYESLFNTIVIAPHEKAYEAFLRTPTLLVVLFVFGYIFTVPSKREEQHE